MINKVAFTGREEMLVKPLDVNRIFGRAQYVSEATIFPCGEKAVKAAEQIVNKAEEFISPFAPISIQPGKILNRIG